MSTNKSKAFLIPCAIATISALIGGAYILGKKKGTKVVEHKVVYVETPQEEYEEEKEEEYEEEEDYEDIVDIEPSGNGNISLYFPFIVMMMMLV
ncbi:MAG: hypothetical protein Edafosvirus2_21 [Edafosvirus sp.]|uniref:Uncharacterized protein n=1 Tax=Edafosvirus sp. TaxID=2487765 RepID=A0A3G4ZSF3_9VIRU|nr:MAG: hypothetical protein Edafosvirus2_21 [Edafosvirus sp.]